VSWKTVALGDVCSIVNGGTPKSEVSEYWDGDLNWITPKEMGKLLSKEISSTERKITLQGMKNSSAKLLPINSVILSSRAPIGHLAINKSLMATNQGCKGLVPSEALSYEYLYYFLSHSKKLLNDMGSGATFKELSGSKLATVEIPLPTLEVQKNIVAKLDVIFAEIDKAKAASEANVKNAESLFQSYLTEIFERGGEGWFNLRLQELLDKGWIISHLDGNHGGDYPRKEEFISSGVPYISANCLDGDILDLSKSKFLSKERASKLRKGLAKTDDVLFAHNATVGPVAILKTTEEVTILGTSLTYYRCNKKFIEPEYLANYMRSAKFKNQYLTIMRQSTRNQIPITKQREFFHVIPPVEEQKLLLKKFNVFLSMKTVYESKALKKINELTLLKQSILQKAFTGELVRE
jgi:type I restriction enzyme S subunit